MNETKAERLYNSILDKVVNIVGNGRTSTSQLMDTGRRILGNTFRGVFPVDRIGSTTLNHHHPYCVINLDESHKRGSHWVALCLSDEGKTIIYDSFGRASSAIVPSLSYFDLVSTDQDREQSYDSENCGARSLAFLIFCSLYGTKAAMLI